MALICRLAGRQLCSQLANYERNTLMFIRPVTMKSVPFKPLPLEGHDEHNMSLGRPQSPHLLIYKPQVTSMLSISHRMTGVALSGYAMMLGMGALLPGDMTTFLDNLHLSATCIFSIKMVLAFPFSYHFVNGIRHLSWDMGKFLTIKDVYTTGYIMLAIATAMSIGLATM